MEYTQNITNIAPININHNILMLALEIKVPVGTNNNRIYEICLPTITWKTKDILAPKNVFEETHMIYRHNANQCYIMFNIQSNSPIARFIKTDLNQKKVPEELWLNITSCGIPLYQLTSLKPPSIKYLGDYTYIGSNLKMAHQSYLKESTKGNIVSIDRLGLQ
ncbi:TPA_asm: hypothetical protein [Girado virus 1]|nr:TPA_asm: hypothetical protein [Girado virus 1]